MRRNSFPRLLKRLKIVRIELTVVYGVSIHRELNMTARACHALIIRCVALHMQILILIPASS